MIEPAPDRPGWADESAHAPIGWAVKTNGRTPEISSIPAPEPWRAARSHEPQQSDMNVAAPGTGFSGLACLAAIARFHDLDVSEPYLLQVVSPARTDG